MAIGAVSKRENFAVTKAVIEGETMRMCEETREKA